MCVPGVRARFARVVVGCYACACPCPYTMRVRAGPLMQHNWILVGVATMAVRRRLRIQERPCHTRTRRLCQDGPGVQERVRRPRLLRFAVACPPPCPPVCLKWPSVCLNGRTNSNGQNTPPSCRRLHLPNQPTNQLVNQTRAAWQHTLHRYIQYAFCCPSRNSFMTGRRPSKTKVWNFIDHFREPETGLNWTSMPGQ